MTDKQLTDADRAEVAARTQDPDAIFIGAFSLTPNVTPDGKRVTINQTVIGRATRCDVARVFCALVVVASRAEGITPSEFLLHVVDHLNDQHDIEVPHACH